MQFLRGNRAIRDHVQDGRDLLLFEATSRSGLYRYVGAFGCVGWEYAPAPDVEGQERRAVIFRLVPLLTEGSLEEAISADLTSLSLDDLRARAYEAAARVPNSPGVEAR